jgi:hypothetical protein
MCCFFTTLLFFGPRLAFLIYWLLPYGRVKVTAVFNTWFWPLLGLIFLPWTTLMYVIVADIGGGLVWFDWIWVGLAFLADIAGYVGGARNRERVPGYPGP